MGRQMQAALQLSLAACIVQHQLLGFQNQRTFRLQGVPGRSQTTEPLSRPFRTVVIGLQSPSLEGIDRCKLNAHSLRHAARCLHV